MTGIFRLYSAAEARNTILSRNPVGEVNVTPSQALAEAVQVEIGYQLETLSRSEIIAESLQNQGGAVICANPTEAVELNNQYVPEHLCLHVRDPWALVGKVKNAGGIFGPDRRTERPRSSSKETVMKIQKATSNDEAILLALMRESFEQETEATSDEWAKTEAAIKTLLNDSQAGEAYLTLDDNDGLLGYIIMCRGFSLDYGGYFTWVEESYMRKSEQGRFRDERFSP